MMFQPILNRLLGLFRSPEDMRVHNQQLDNLERLIKYNNRRVSKGLHLVTMPPALTDQYRPARLGYQVTMPPAQHNSRGAPTR